MIARMGYVIIGIIFVVALCMLGVGLSDMARKRKRKAALANRDAILDGVFVGPTATYRSTVETLPFAVVVDGATARGYELTAQHEERGDVTVLAFRRS